MKNIFSMFSPTILLFGMHLNSLWLRMMGLDVCEVEVNALSYESEA